MAPPMSVGLQALVDQAEASLRDLLQDYPTFLADIRENARSAGAARMVAIDTLAALAEDANSSVEHRLDLVTARLCAWNRLAGGR